MDFLPEEIEKYVDKHTEEEPLVLKKLNRETNSKVLNPRMLSGHLQGRILSMISHMIQPEQILEIGTYTGYSAISMAEGLSEKGTLHTIDINEELEDMVNLYIEEAGYSDKIKTYIGNALDIIPEIEAEFDLVFIDADKVNYSRYYDMVFNKVKKGGYIVADNVLWSGKVLEEEKMDDDTKALVEYSAKIQQDERVQNVLFPVRDGLMIARKK